MQQLAQFARTVATAVAGFFQALWRRTAPMRASLRTLPAWKRIAVWSGAGVLAVVLYRRAGSGRTAPRRWSGRACPTWTG